MALSGLLSVGLMGIVGCSSILSPKTSARKFYECCSTNETGKIEYFMGYEPRGNVICYIVGPAKSGIPDSKSNETRVYINGREMERITLEEKNHPGCFPHATLKDENTNQVYQQQLITMKNDLQNQVDKKYHSLVH